MTCDLTWLDVWPNDLWLDLDLHGNDLWLDLDLQGNDLWLDLDLQQMTCCHLCLLVNFLRGNYGTTCRWKQRAYNNVSAGSLPPVPPEGRTPRLSLACRGHTDGSDIWWLSRKTFKLLGPSIGQIFPARFSTGYSSVSSWSGFLRVLRFPPPEKTDFTIIISPPWYDLAGWCWGDKPRLTKPNRRFS